MSPTIASFVFAVGILGLFWLNREQQSRTSIALWIPVAWMLVVGSRPISVWLQISPQTPDAAQYLEGSPLDRFVFSVFLVLGLCVLMQRGRRVITCFSSNWPILLFYFYCATSVLWSDYPGVAFKRWIKALSDLVMVVIILTDPDPLAAIKRVLARVGFLLIPVSMLLIKYYPELGRTYSPWSWTPVYVGVTTNKNTLGMVTMIFGVGAVWQLVELIRMKDPPNRARRMIAQSVLLLIAAWLFQTANSATSMSCFLIAGCLIIVTGLSRWGRKRAVIHLLVVAAISLSLFALFFNSGGDLVESLGRSSTLTGRTELWSVVLQVPVSRLLGAGFESFWLGTRLQQIWSIYWWHPNESHNGYIELLLNLGWLGVGLFVFVVLNGYSKIMAYFRKQMETSNLRLAYFTIALIYAFTEAGFRMMTFTWVFLLFATSVGNENPVRETQPVDSIITDDVFTDTVAQVGSSSVAMPREDAV